MDAPRSVERGAGADAPARATSASVRPKDPRTGRFLPVTGVDAFIGRARNGDLDRRFNADRHLLVFEKQLQRDLGGLESLSAQEGAIVGRVAFADAICGAVEAYVRTHGVLYQGGRIRPTVARLLDLWSRFDEAERRGLQLLGMRRRLKEARGLNAYLLQKHEEHDG